MLLLVTPSGQPRAEDRLHTMGWAGSRTWELGKSMLVSPKGLGVTQAYCLALCGLAWAMPISCRLWRICRALSSGLCARGAPLPQGPFATFAPFATFGPCGSLFL